MHVTGPPQLEPSTTALGGGHTGSGGSEQMVALQTNRPFSQEHPSSRSFVTQGGCTEAGQKRPWELHAAPLVAPAQGLGHEGAPSWGHFHTPPLQEQLSAWVPSQSVRCWVHCVPDEHAEVMF